jgi:hypothetical protein
MDKPTHDPKRPVSACEFWRHKTAQGWKPADGLTDEDVIRGLEEEAKRLLQMDGGRHTSRLQPGERPPGGQERPAGGQGTLAFPTMVGEYDAARQAYVFHIRVSHPRASPRSPGAD